MDDLEISKPKLQNLKLDRLRVRPIDWKVFPNKLGQVDRL